MPTVRVHLHKIVLHFLDEQGEHTETEHKDGCFDHSSNQGESALIEGLQDEEHTVGHADGEEIGDDWYFNHDFVGDDVAVVVADDSDVREQGEDVPSIFEEGTIEAACYFLVFAALARFLELVVEGEEVHFEVALEGVDLEGRFYHQVAEFGSFHWVEESHVAVGGVEDGFVDEDVS